MAPSLRPYQRELIDDAQKKMRTQKWVCAVLPTGAGKTLTATEVVRRSQAKGKRVYWTAHRKELVEQASQGFMKAGIPHGLVMVGEKQTDHRVQVCSIQSLSRRLDSYERPDLLIMDECHHVKAKTWMDVVERWRGAFCLGLTATPRRLDGKGLKDVFGGMVVGPSIEELIKAGYLCKFRLFSRPLDMSGIKVTGGDYNKEQMEKRVREAHIMGDLMDEYRSRGGGQMVVFAPTIQYSKDFVAYNDGAVHVDGKTTRRERGAILNDFKAKRIKILSNVDLFTEGVDIPSIEYVGILRPTHSEALFLQMAGRGLRNAEGKNQCIVLDHAGNCGRHGLIDDDREWKLETDKIKQKTVEASVTICTKCFGAYRGTNCPYCGLERTPAQARKIKEIEGKLVEMKKTKEERKKEKTMARYEYYKAKSEIASYEDAEKFAKERGYKPGWAMHYWSNKKKG